MVDEVHDAVAPAPGVGGLRAVTDGADLAARAIEHGANQKAEELAAFLDFLARRELRCVVEIGTQHGGTFYAWCEVAADDATVVSIDLPGGPFGGGYPEEAVERFRGYARGTQDLHFLRADSHDPATRSALEEILAGRPIDFLFVDGDHTYYGVRRDFELYSPLVADDGVIAFHDVLPHPEVPEVKVDVLWRELKKLYDHLEFAAPGDNRGWGPWGGIGVLVGAQPRRRARSLPAAAAAALMEEVAAARTERGGVEQQVRALEEVRAGLEERVAALASELDRAQERERAARDAVTALQSELEALQRELAAAHERERTAVETIAAATQTIAEQTQTIAEQTQTIAEQTQTIAEHEDALARAREAERTLRETLERAEGELDRTRKRARRARNDVARLERERETLRSQVAALEEEVASVGGQRERALYEAAAARARASVLEEELDGERRRRAAEGEAAAAEIAALAAEAARGRDAVAFLELLFATRGWRALDRYRRARTRLRTLRPPPLRRASAADPAADGSSPAAVAAEGHAPHPADIAFAEVSDPAVSIVVPVYENLELTLRCLASLAATLPEGVAEVIVVDDGSSEATSRQLARVEGLRLLRNERNVGFLASCNAGAAAAAGEYVLFLNNDTEATEGWLEALVDAARSAADVGAVGSKLVYPDGRLQEAGGVIWSDATGLNFGRGDDPDAPEYNFRREVDYCSGASLLVRRDVFERLGGFDVRYGTGYYEDTDLCFALRREGFRTLYEPGSVVIHHEGGTHGTDERPGLPGAHSKASQYSNRHVFRVKWAVELARHWPPGTAGGLRGGRVERRPHVLVADTWLPAYDRDSGSLRMTWILRLLRSLGCGVTLFPLNRERREPYARALQRLGVEVHYGPRTFQELAAGRSDLYDLVILSRPDVASVLLADVRAAFPRATVLYDTVDLHFRRERRRLELLGAAPSEEHVRARDIELDCMRRSDLVATISDEEAQIVREQVPTARTVVLPNVHELDPSPPRPFAERADLLFIGSFQHPPNVDAVLHLVGDVLPLLAESLDARLLVLGADPPDEIRRLQSPRVVVTGYLPDVDEYFRRAHVFVAPLRYGAGMKGKVGHALAFGLPVVTTPIGAEGMDLVDGEHLLVRDGADALAQAVAAVYRDEDLWGRLSEGGRAVVRERWTPEAMRLRLERLLRETAVELPETPQLAAGAA
ncbi:MAG: glycosyltransferase [Thermoleophilia bacterium]|nr:glycosyltransferase [Thermoleophilia bacterium]